jgi:hypothetical protein
MPRLIPGLCREIGNGEMVLAAQVANDVAEVAREIATGARRFVRRRIDLRRRTLSAEGFGRRLAVRHGCPFVTSV